MIDKRPQPGTTTGTHKCTAECPDDLQRFWRQTLRAWVAVTTTTIRALDPNHLIAAPRMSVATSSEYCFFGIDSCTDRFLDGRTVPQRELYSPWSLLRREGDVGFDVVAINVYSRAGRAGFDEPWFAQGIHKVTDESGLPVIISEFGVRSIQPGWSNSGGAPAYVPSGGDVQARRGRYYQIDMNRFLDFRNVIGASFHRWADRFDDEDQINMGLVQRDGSRWRGMDSRVRGLNQSVYGKIADKTGL